MAHDSSLMLARFTRAAALRRYGWARRRVGDAWTATAGALGWLGAHAPAGKRRKRHRPR